MSGRGRVAERSSMMAAPAVELETVSRPGRSPKTRASSLRHKVRSQNVVMKESEQSLHKLMEDFELGRLNAFGNSDVLQRVNEIREMQKKLTIRHFELDQSKFGGEENQDPGLHGLVQNLEELGAAIQSLNSTNDPRKVDGKPQKKVCIQISDS